MATLQFLTPDPYIVLLACFGLLIALVAWLPLALKRMPLSLPIVCIGLGAAIFALPQVTLVPLPSRHPEITERLTELVVIIALMGAGLKIDRRISWRRWGITWRLLAVTMPLSIAAIALLGAWAGLPLAAAILLAGLPGADRSGAGFRRPGRPAPHGRGGRGAVRPDLGGRAQ